MSKSDSLMSKRRTVEHERVDVLIGISSLTAEREARRENFVSVVAQRKRQQLRDLRRVVNQQDARQSKTTSCRCPAGQPLLLAGGRLQIQHPDAAAGRVVGAMVVLDHRAPRFQRAHREGVSLEVVARVVEHFVRVPVVGEDGVTRVHAHDGVVTVVRGLGPHVARRSALLAFR